jgi:glucose/mannose-6-phosphate isomerase
MSGAAPGPDSLGFHIAASRVPEHTEAAVLAAQDAALPDGRGVQSVVLLGEGAARWSADVVAAIASRTSSVPIVVGGSTVPAFAGASTTVIELGARALRVDHDVVPLGIDVPHERAALGAMVAAALTALGRMGLVEGIEADLDHAIAQLHHRRGALFGGAASDVDAPKLARRIGRLLPLVYGEGAVGGLAAERWKQQCNVNAKVPAFARSLPQVAHDEIAGWGQHGDVTRQVFCAVVLRHDHERDGADARFATLTEVLEESLAAVHHVRASGEGPLAQLLDLAYIGDAVSLHLAFQEGLDPGPAPALGLLA